jgi:hypothetical protein
MKSNNFHDHYRQLVVDLEETAPPHRALQLTFRAYDSGVAFCYTLPKQAGLDSVPPQIKRGSRRGEADAEEPARRGADGGGSAESHGLGAVAVVKRRAGLDAATKVPDG